MTTKPWHREMLTRVMLEHQGYQVLQASNGVEALQLWQELRGAVALLLTDLVMPGGLSGLELARRLCSGQRKLKVIFTSGYSEEIAGRELQLRRGESFVQKPSSAHNLLETVWRSLDG